MPIAGALTRIRACRVQFQKLWDSPGTRLNSIQIEYVLLCT
jgi:hypothetical protein